MELTMTESDRVAQGLAMRRKVLGDAYVDRAMGGATPFDKPLQDFVLEHCWGEVWTRPGLDAKTRSMLNVAMLAAAGHHQELALHVAGARRNGCTDEEIQEVLLQVGVYFGVPAAVSAFRIARDSLLAMSAEEGASAAATDGVVSD